jgi:hypothetical protein
MHYIFLCVCWGGGGGGGLVQGHWNGRVFSRVLP